MGLVGRKVETRTLREAVAGVAAGGRATLGLFGEAGIGKSTLLGEAASAAEEAGQLVLGGRSAEHESEVPFGLVVDALDDAAGRLRASRIEEIEGELATVLPSLRSAGSAAAEPVDSAGRFRLNRALAALLDELAREAPVALLLDDLHWADDASLEFVLHLLRHPPARPHLLVLALRPSPAELRVLDAARSAPGWTEIRVPPLDPDDAAALLPAELQPAQQRELIAEAGGNPLYLTELARLPAGADSLPRTLLAAISRELAGLPPASRTLIEGAAIAGDPFDPDTAAVAAGIEPDDAPALLDGLAAANLIVPAPQGRGFAFRHPLLQRAVYDESPAGRRIAAHARVAAALAAQGAAPEERAHHVERSARPGDLEAAALLGEAAANVRGRSPAAAAHWLGAAAALVPYEEAERREALRTEQARALIAAGRLAQARELLEELIDATPEGDRGALVTLAHEADILLGRHERAGRHLEQVLDAVPEDERPQILVQLSATSLFSGNGRAAQAWVKQAIPPFEQREDASALASAWSLLAYARLWSGEPAGPELGRASERMAAVPDSELAGHLHRIWSVGAALLEGQRYAEALPVLERSLRLAKGSHQEHLQMRISLLVAAGELPLLRLARAAELAEVAEGMGRLLGLEAELAFTLVHVAQIALERGDRAAAERAAAEADALAAGQLRSAEMTATRALAATITHAAAPAALIAALEDAGGRGLQELPPPRALEVMPALVTALLEEGRTGEAKEQAGRLAAGAELMALPKSAVDGAVSMARVELAEGEPGAAAERALAAAGSARATGLGLAGLQAGTVAGRALIAAGERERGVALLNEVAADAGRAGASAARDAAGRELRRAGARVSAGASRGAGGGPGELTGREREIALLVAEGRTNKEVGAALYVSAKTVEHHLSRIYAKLGVRSRTELAALREQLTASEPR